MNLISGVTTNPSLMARGKGEAIELVRTICAVSPGPVSVQVTEDDAEDMLRTARYLAKQAANVVIKVPATRQGCAAAAALEADGIPANVTLCFTLAQALWAFSAGVSYLSVFSGRLTDEGSDGEATLREIVTVLRQDSTTRTQIIAAALNRPDHVVSAARAGADFATTSPEVLDALLECELTEKGLEKFRSDWRASGHRY